MIRKTISWVIIWTIVGAIAGGIGGSPFITGIVGIYRGSVIGAIFGAVAGGVGVMIGGVVTLIATLTFGEIRGLRQAILIWGMTGLLVSILLMMISTIADVGFASIYWLISCLLFGMLGSIFGLMIGLIAKGVGWIVDDWDFEIGQRIVIWGAVGSLIGTLVIGILAIDKTTTTSNWLSPTVQTTPAEPSTWLLILGAIIGGIIGYFGEDLTQTLSHFRINFDYHRERWPTSGALKSALGQTLRRDLLGLPAVIVLILYWILVLLSFSAIVLLPNVALTDQAPAVGPAAYLIIGFNAVLMWLLLFFRRAWLILVINQKANGEPVNLWLSLSTTVRRLPIVLIGFGLFAIPIYVLTLITTTSIFLNLLLILFLIFCLPVMYLAQTLLLTGESLWPALTVAFRYILTYWKQGLGLGLIALPAMVAIGNIQHRLILPEEYSQAMVAIVLSGVILSFLEVIWYGTIARYTAYTLQDADPYDGQRLGRRWKPVRSLVVMLLAAVLFLVIGLAPPSYLFHRAIAVRMITLGGERYEAGEYLTAIEHYQRATEAYQSADDLIGQVVAHSRLADTYVALDRYDEAVNQNSRAQALFPPDSKDPALLALKANLGIIYRHQGRYPEAQALYEKLLVDVRQLQDQALLSSLLVDLSTVAFLRGHYDQAQRYLSAALPLFRQQNNQEFIARALANLSSANVQLGQWFEAIKDAEEAVSIYESGQIDDPAYEAVARLSLAGAYHRVGDPLRALEQGKMALDLARTANDLTNEGRVLSELAAIAITLAAYDEASSYIEQSVTIAREQGDPNALSIRLVTAALIQLRLNRLTEAETLLIEALDMARTETEQYQRGQALALDGLGNVYMRRDQLKEAIDSLQAALAIEREMGDRLLEANTLANLGLAHLLGDRRVEALRDLEAAANMLEHLRTDLHLPDLRASFLTDWQEIYHLLVTLLVDDGKTIEAFNYSERARARAFLDQLVSGPIDFRSGTNGPLLVKERMLRDQIAALRTQLSALHDDRFSTQDPEDIKARQEQLQTELTNRETEYEDLLLELQIHSPELATLISVDVATLSDIQSLLDTDTTLIEYFVTEERTFAFIITSDKFETVTLDVSREALNNALNILHDFASLDDPHPPHLQQLHEWLITPLQPHLTTPTIGIVPHSVLHYLPFAALTDGQRYLSDDYALFTLPSASVLRFLHEKRKPEANTLLALGQPTTAESLPPLPFAFREVQAIADLYGTQPLVGVQATESAVWSGAGQAGILHLAAHGEYNRRNPLFSVIHLVGDDQRDGRLEVHEVYGLDLTVATDLVVLSACQTQLGKLSEGDEIVGLNRAFLYAGTPSILASLWNVNDEATALLMERFYTHLQAGMGKAEALRQAQIEVRGDYPHPYYWAAFVLTGDGDGR